jgi:hypothetical protein
VGECSISSIEQSSVAECSVSCLDLFCKGVLSLDSALESSNLILLSSGCCISFEFSLSLLIAKERLAEKNLHSGVDFFIHLCVDIINVKLENKISLLGIISKPHVIDGIIIIKAITIGNKIIQQ